MLLSKMSKIVKIQMAISRIALKELSLRPLCHQLILEDEESGHGENAS